MSMYDFIDYQEKNYFEISLIEFNVTGAASGRTRVIALQELYYVIQILQFLRVVTRSLTLFKLERKLKRRHTMVVFHFLRIFGAVLQQQPAQVARKSTHRAVQRGIPIGCVLHIPLASAP